MRHEIFPTLSFRRLYDYLTFFVRINYLIELNILQILFDFITYSVVTYIFLILFLLRNHLHLPSNSVLCNRL